MLVLVIFPFVIVNLVYGAANDNFTCVYRPAFNTSISQDYKIWQITIPMWFYINAAVSTVFCVAFLLRLLLSCLYKHTRVM